MNKLIALSALAGLLTLAASTGASAWTRTGSVTGPKGSITTTVKGSCSGGTCTRDTTRTGTNGKTVTTSGTASCSGGSCTGTRTTTGPNGKSTTRTGTISKG